MSFHVGQKVVCVDDAYFWYPGLVQRPVRGIVYVIRAFTYGICSDGSRGEGLLLVGVQNRNGAGGLEHGFKPGRFRPIVERKTDISIFTAMLTPAKQGVSA